MELVKASARLSAAALGYSTLKKCSKAIHRKILIHVFIIISSFPRFFVSVSHFSVPTFSMTHLRARWDLARETNVSFTPRLSHPGFRDPCTPWNAPCIPVYWRTHVRGLQTALAKNDVNDWSYSCLTVSAAVPWRISTKIGRWMRRHIV